MQCVCVCGNIKYNLIALICAESRSRQEGEDEREWERGKRKGNEIRGEAVELWQRSAK